MVAVTSSPRRWWALVAIVLSILTIGFDTTILNVALPTLATDLHAGTGELQWLVDAYVLVFAGLLLPMGALGDRYGRRKLLLIGLALFAGASAVAVFASTAGQVIAARAVMGIGAAILTPITLAVLPVLFEPHERGKAIAVTTMGMGLGLPLGPIIGGYLLEHFWWGSIFLINVPVALVAIVAVTLLIPESRAASPRPADIPGGVLSTAGLVLLVYGTIEAPSRGWTDALVLATLGLGAALLVAFVLVERRRAAPMIDLRLFRRPRFAWGTAAGTVASFALFGLLFILPQFLQSVLGHTALGVGLRLLPLIGGLFVGAPLGERLGHLLTTRVPVAAGLLIGACGLLLGVWSLRHGTGYGFVATWLAVTGLGIGLALAPATDAVLGELPRDEAGAGTAVTMTLRQVAGALGVALLGSLASAVYTAASPGLRSVAADVASPALALAARGAFVDAMSAVLLVCAAFALIGAALTAVFLPAAAAGPAHGADPAGGAGESKDELTGVA
ncbi:DHA2 family efflux MFS transporter permease subunit [Dactylosporangium sp. NBC_01737]|uniref:DHA2 family efflux MFS transporter permease subunit n=1 Tax=Dactylosporangium sp. NBC_01737 TaxID=2975959 RepID=UPI002E15F7B8|nr:DHA2 family efflux MFS transporter permease subunit [Dactylosporangium sp. NBC_01737]